MSPSNPSMLVRVFWGDILYDTVVCEDGAPTSVGREPGCTFVLDLGKKITVSKLPLITVKNDKTAILVFSEHMEGHVRTGGKLITLEKARAQNLATPADNGLYQIALKSEDTASIVIGYVSFDIAWAKTRTILPRPIILDRNTAIFGGAACVTILLMLILLNWTIEPPKEEDKPERMVEILTPHRSRPTPEPPSAEPPTAKAAASATVAQQQPVATPPAAAATPPPPSAAEELRSADLSSLVGNLSSLGNTIAPQVKDQAPAARSPSSNTSMNTGLKNSAIGQSVSIGSEVSKNVGNFQAAGALTSSNASISSGTGGALSGPSGKSGPSGLDRAVIDQIVRRRQDRIRLCYERQLNFVPGLAGKVTVQFIIGREGEVRKSSTIEDTMNNKAVKECILSEVKEWTFPRPKGDTDVVVDYPFVFESGAALATSKGQ